MPHRLSLDDISAELDRGRVWECRLRDPRWHLDGLSLGENVYIDPRPAILETLCHELIHRRYPRWAERTVHREARRLVAKMDEPTIRRWWRHYNRVKRKGRPVDTGDT